MPAPLQSAAPRAPHPALLALLCVATLAAPTAAQERDQPALDQLREVFAQPGLTLGLLLQAVVDPGIDDTEASAQVPQARLLVSGTLDRGFSYLLQTNFAASPSLLDARVTWSSSPSFSVSAGRFKTPFSQELLAFAGNLDFVGRSRVVDALAPNRQLGAQVGGALDETVSWSIGGFTGGSNATPNESLAGVARLQGGGIEVGEGTLTVAGHVAVGRDGAIGTRALGSGYVGDGVLLGLDGRFESGRLLLAGELIRADWDPTVGPGRDASGLYLTGGWTFRPFHQALVRWDRYRAPLAPEADDVLVLGYTTWPTDAAKIQVNGRIPLRDSAEPYRLLANFQISF